MQIEWCNKQITIEEAEQKNLVEDPRLGDNPIPFGFMNVEWILLKLRFKKGDELWEFKNPKRYWINLAGREGVCIVRDGEVVGSITTTMS